jgi:hypothetical protein
MDTAVRTITNKAAAGLSRPWADSVRSAIRRREEGLGDELDQAVARTDLGANRSPRWWGVARLLQWLLFLIALGGALWLVAMASFSYLQLNDPPLPKWHSVPYATIMLIGGAALGVVVSVCCRLFAASGANRRARLVAKALRSELETVADSHVVASARDELEAYSRCRDQIAIARG